MRTALRNPRGFTLIELAIALAVLALLASVAVPYAATQIRNQAAEKVAREMLAIADAAKSYYLANAAWPANLSILQEAGYLPAVWGATNPFGNAYTVTSGTTLTVASTVPADLAPTVARLVPLGTQAAVAGGTTVAGSWPRPGQSSDLASVQGLPPNAVVFYNGTDCTAAGLTELTSARGRVIVGLPPGGALAGTVGAALANLESRVHAHTYSDVIAHTHAVNDPGHTHTISDPGHSHTTTGYIGSQGWAPPYMADIRYSGAQLAAMPTNAATTGIGITASGTGITLAPTGVPTGITAPAGAAMPYLQLAVCKKS